MPISTDCANEKERETTYKLWEQGRWFNAVSPYISFRVFETLCSHQLYVFDLRCRIFEHANPLLFIITKHRLWPFGVNGFPPQTEFQSQKLLQFRS